MPEGAACERGRGALSLLPLTRRRSAAAAAAAATTAATAAAVLHLLLPMAPVACCTTHRLSIVTARFSAVAGARRPVPA
jgi:hypothetical protein